MRWIGESSFGKQIVGECMEWIAGFRGQAQLRGPHLTKQNQKYQQTTKKYQQVQKHTKSTKVPKIKLRVNAWEWIAGFRGLNSAGPISCSWVKNTPPSPHERIFLDFYILVVVQSGHKKWSYAKHWSINNLTFGEACQKFARSFEQFGCLKNLCDLRCSTG